MNIDDTTARRIKESARIEDVVGDFLQLRRTGSRYTAICPFHDDRHDGNFIVYPRGNVFKCFACGAAGDSIEFLMRHTGMTYPDALRWLGQKYGIFLDDERIPNIRPAVPRELPPPPPDLPKRYWPIGWVNRYLADEGDTFVRWLHTLPWDDAQRARIPKVLAAYRVGHSHFTTEWNRQHEVHDFTIFWQIDGKGRLCNGHFMKYKPDGHRMKDKGAYNTTWLHARMKYADPNKMRPFDEDHEQAAYCLFGEHLADIAPNATINIVESEKSAILMSIAYGCLSENIWMACYGMGNLVNTNHLLAPLIAKKRRIVLYPDHDGVDKWREALATIDYKRILFNTDFVTKFWRESDGDKADVADVVLRMLEGHSPKYQPERVGDILARWREQYKK